jgi:plasmid stabilization system protein ParE
VRRVLIAASAIRSFQTLLAQGAAKFGITVAMEKERIVYALLSGTLSVHPYRGRHDPHLRLNTYHVSDTPFVLVYEYDAAELRVLFILHQRADRRRLSPGDVEW